MILSLKYNFIFIHIPKTGGTSIRNALAPYSEDIRPYLTDFGKAIVTGQQRAGLNINPPHVNLVGAAKMLNVDLKDFLVVCVVRDPIERMKSYYRYLKYNNPTHRLHDLAANSSIDEFVERFILDEGHDTKTQFSYFAPSEDLIVKGHNVICYERLDEEFSRLQDNLDLPKIKLQKLNQSKNNKVLSLSHESKNLIMAFECQTAALMGYC